MNNELRQHGRRSIPGEYVGDALNHGATLENTD